MVLWWQFLTRGLAHLLAPACCHGCGDVLQDGAEVFCPRCHAELLSDPHESCPRCGHTVGPFSALDGSCSACRGESWPLDAVVRLGPYEGALRDLVLRLKSSRGEVLAE